jgi:hypothetical protein
MRIAGFFTIALFLLNACGDDKKDYAGALGTCSMTMPLIGSVCSEYTYTAKAQKDDPKGSAQAEMETSCQASTGTWSSTGNCTTENLLGRCEVVSSSNSASVTSKTFYYSSASLTTEIVQASCTQGGGTFSAP